MVKSSSRKIRDPIKRITRVQYKLSSLNRIVCAGIKEIEVWWLRRIDDKIVLDQTISYWQRQFEQEVTWSHYGLDITNWLYFSGCSLDGENPDSVARRVNSWHRPPVSITGECWCSLHKRAPWWVRHGNGHSKDAWQRLPQDVSNSHWTLMA